MFVLSGFHKEGFVGQQHSAGRIRWGCAICGSIGPEGNTILQTPWEIISINGGKFVCKSVCFKNGDQVCQVAFFLCLLSLFDSV